MCSIYENSFDYAWAGGPNFTDNITVYYNPDCDYHCLLGNSVTMIIPEGFTEISPETLNSCYEGDMLVINKLIIPSSVSYIDVTALRDFYKTTGFEVKPDNLYFSTEDGVLFNKEKTILLLYPNGRYDESYIIPDGVTTIGEWSFFDCPSLSKITIPYGVTSIGDYAFSQNEFKKSPINSIVLPSSVNKIGEFAFAGCVNLDAINIPKSVTRIENGTFYRCYSLKNVILPDGITYIGEGAFQGCHFTNIDLPDSVNYIGDGAFFKCYDLQRIRIPEGVTVLSDDLFFGCQSLNSITLPQSLESIGEGVFTYCWSLDSITIPKSVTEIKDLWPTHQYNAVFGEKDSYIEKYALENDYPFYVIGIFPDVKERIWYYEAARHCAQNGYISGYANGNFGSADNLKRQDFVVILSNIAKADLSNYKGKISKLKDVDKNSYYAAAVNWAVEHGIISGYQNGKFGVGDNITREQVATILYRYMGSPAVGNASSTLAGFKDSKNVSPFAKNAMAWAVQNNIISGMADGRIAPTEGASRAQIAVIIQKMDQQGMFDKTA